MKYEGQIVPLRELEPGEAFKIVYDWGYSARSMVHAHRADGTTEYSHYASPGVDYENSDRLVMRCQPDTLEGRLPKAPQGDR